MLALLALVHRELAGYEARARRRLLHLKLPYLANRQSLNRRALICDLGHLTLRKFSREVVSHQVQAFFDFWLRRRLERLDHA